ncbi:MAG: TIGR00730 family Rossman fold protein [Frankiaceae bacterium]
MNVCVFCSSSTRIAPRHVELAAEVGREIGRRGHGLVSGGGNISCMGAVARGARELGARTVGVIPDTLALRELADTEAHELLVVETMRQRKAEMDRRADAFLALPGGIGTLEELFEAWTARTLGMHDRPVVVLDPYGVYLPLRELVDRLAIDGFVHDHAVAALHWTSTVGEALDACEAAVPAPDRPAPEEVLEAEP